MSALALDRTSTTMLTSPGSSLAHQPLLSARNREIFALSATAIGVCLLVIGTVGIVFGLLLGGPLATTTIIAITLADILKNFALTTTGKIIGLSIVSLFVGGVCLISGSSALG